MVNESSNIWLATNPAYAYTPSRPKGSTDAVKIAFGVLLLAFIHYHITRTLHFFVSRRREVAKLPPLVPHSIPLVGSMPWGYLWNASNFVCSSK